MAIGPRLWHLVLILILELSVSVYGVAQVPCYFIFGASLYDNGNNNILPTTARANYLPYGIDFPTGPTGRFSNGQNMGDIIAELLGFDNPIPPFATASGLDILKGVNYASGSSGIRDETGQHLGARITMNNQLLNHETTVTRIVSVTGDKESAAKYLSKCIYTVGMGTNDYISNYLLPQLYPTSRSYTPDQYARVLTQQYSRQLKTLYDYGARKIAVFGIGPLGCTPANVAIHGTNGSSSCVDYINTAVQLFNTRLKTLVDDLNKNLHDSRFIYINTYDIMSSISIGFRVKNMPCCEVGRNNANIVCTPLRIPCPNRGEYVWWDGTHPTEAANLMVAGRSYNSQFPSDTCSIDIYHLALL